MSLRGAGQSVVEVPVQFVVLIIPDLSGELIPDFSPINRDKTVVSILQNPSFKRQTSFYLGSSGRQGLNSERTTQLGHALPHRNQTNSGGQR